MTQPLDRRTILEEARRLFARYGFRKTSLTDIVRGLGVGKTAVYHHFPGGKTEIIDTCLQHEEESVLSKMRTAVDSHEDPRQQLRAMVAAKIEHIAGLRQLLTVHREVGRELGQLSRQHERRFHLHEEALIEKILRRGQDLGIFRPANPQRLASALSTMLARLEIEIAFDDRASGVHEQLDTVLEVVFHGLISDGLRSGRMS